MLLVKLQTIDRKTVLINPDHIVSVEIETQTIQGKEGSKVVLTGFKTTLINDNEYFLHPSAADTIHKVILG